MSDTFVLPKKIQAKLVVMVENDRAKRDDRKAAANARKEQQRLEQETAAAREAAEKLADEQYQRGIKTINAIRRKGGNVIGLVNPVRVHVPTFNAALEKLGLDSCDLLAYANKVQRQKAAKLWANHFADGLAMLYPKANMKKKHRLFMGVV